MSNIRVRFPPSPTGFCHVGTARMAVLNYLFAHKHGGTIVFRSEDTDKERSSPEFEEDILDSLKWLGLSWDEFYRQSERTEIYRAALSTLIDEGKAYVSEEESKKEAGVKVRIIRLKNPGTKITFTDIIRGDITFDTTELKDFAIARSDVDPLYHLAVVVDDSDMKITHVIRGEDHISNTPRQILIQEALGISRPVYAHYPLHLSANRSKLSKRKGDVAVRSYREQGYLPEALLNYLAVLGWTPPSGKEILSLPEMIGEFDLRDIHKSGAVFDIEKLKWFNHEYLKRLSDDEFAGRLADFVHNPFHVSSVGFLKERSVTLKEAADALTIGEYDFLDHEPDVPLELLLKGSGVDAPVAKENLKNVLEILTRIDGPFTPEVIKAVLFPFATERGRASVFWPMRVALSGMDKYPA